MDYKIYKVDYKHVAFQVAHLYGFLYQDASTYLSTALNAPDTVIWLRGNDAGCVHPINSSRRHN